MKYWTTCSSVRTAHLFTCSTLLTLLALACSLRPLPRSWESELLMSQDDLNLPHSAAQPDSLAVAAAAAQPCLDIVLFYQLRGDAFLRVGLIPRSASPSSHEHPVDEFFFANVSVSDTNRSLLGDGANWQAHNGTLVDEWSEIQGWIPLPLEEFQIVIHAGVNFTSYQSVNVIQLKSIIANVKDCPDEISLPPVRPPPPNFVPCTPRALEEVDCLNEGQCQQLVRNHGVRSQPFCQCPEDWAGRRCEERRWLPPENLRPNATIVQPMGSSDPNSQALLNVTDPSSQPACPPSLSLDPNESLQELALYVVVVVLATIVLVLLISVSILLIQIHHHKERLRSLTEQALTIRNCEESSTIKALDGTDYWTNFR